MTESRLQRWARKKNETRKNAEPVAETSVQTPTAESALPSAETSPDPAEQALATNEALSEKEILAKYNLPDPENLVQGTDITGFLRKEIPEFLRRKALRALWRSNPIFGVLDRLNEYDEDYSKAFIPEGGVKTAYKVGKGGFLDPEKRERERQERALNAETTTDTVRLPEPRQAEAPVQPEEDPQEETLQKEKETQETAEATADDGQLAQQWQPETAEAEREIEAPRFRPRMQFQTQ
jgi:hypothetical protein